MRISISSIAAVNEVASAIVGVPMDDDPIVLTILPDPNAPERLRGQRLSTNAIRAGQEYTEFRFVDEDGRHVGAEVTIIRPRRLYGSSAPIEPATVKWSSSSSDGDLADAATTAKVLGYAAAVALRLNTWAANGQLEYLGAAA